jgi:hypothetical protein
MPRSLRYFILVAVTVAVVYSASRALEEREAATTEAAGALVFPELGTAINTVTQIKGLNEEGPYTLVKKDAAWLLAERGNFPADAGKVSELLVGMAQLKLLEKKTAKAERYAKLGLDEPGKKGSDAHRITLEDASGALKASVILGDSKAARGEPNMAEVYMRLPDDPQTWAALSSMPNISSTVDWLSDELIKFDDQRIAEVLVTHADGETVRIVRTPGVGQGYTLTGVPQGRSVDSEYVVRNVATTLANLVLDDVMPAEQMPLEGVDAVNFTVKTFDGMQVDIKSIKALDQRLVHLAASVLASPPVPPALDEAAEGDHKVKQLTQAEVSAQIETFNRRWQGYTFELGDWRLAPSYKRNADFLAAEEDQAEDKVAPVQPPLPGTKTGAGS